MIVSYSQNLEDILLHRALCHVECGFYIDVGANDPVIDSVTKLFYDAGWRGVNVDPNQHFIDLLNAKAAERHQRARGRVRSCRHHDVHQMGGWAHGLSTTIGEVAKERAHLLERSYDVPTETPDGYLRALRAAGYPFPQGRCRGRRGARISRAGSG
nr:FkbM family methyltransferase [Afipia felis]